MTAADLSAIARQRAFEAEQRRTGSLRKAIVRSQLHRLALSFARFARPYARDVISGLVVVAFTGVAVVAFVAGAAA